MPQSDQPHPGIEIVQPGSNTEPTVEPIPPRYWWLKRFALAAGVFIVAVFALRLWWGWEANRRLQAEIDRIIAAGEPIYPEDFDPKEEIPDDQNAARYLLQAESAINLTTEQAKLLDDLVLKVGELPGRVPELRSIIEPNSAVFEHVRHARGAVGVDWGVRFRTPAFNTLLPWISGQRKLSKLINVAAFYYHGIGRDDLAVELLQNALYQGRAISNLHCSIGHFQMAAAHSTTVRAIEETGSTLRVATAASGGPSDGGSAMRGRIEDLIQELLDDEGYGRSLTHAMQGERMVSLDAIRQTAEGKLSIAAASGFAGPAPSTLWIKFSQYPIAPFFYRSGLAVVRDYNDFVAAASLLNWPTAAAAFPPERRGGSPWEDPLYSFRRSWSPSSDRTFVFHFRALAVRRMAAVSLAVRLYQVDHGKRPETLAALVPEYLPFVPADPFAGDGRSIAYLPNAARPILYCIGPDGIDNKGSFTFRGDRIDADQLDMPFFLDGNRPTKPEEVPPAPQPSPEAGRN